MTKVTLQIEGMSCGHCLNAVNRAIHEVPGAEVVAVQMGRAEVNVPAAAAAAPLAAAVTAAGYPATAVAVE